MWMWSTKNVVSFEVSLSSDVTANYSEAAALPSMGNREHEPMGV